MSNRGYPSSLRGLLVGPLLTSLVFSNTWAQVSDGPSDLGVDYAFMSLITLSPDFAAANYTINNEDTTKVDISIGRLPLHFDLLKDTSQHLELELALAYQRTEQFVETFGSPGENIDSRWNTYGGGIGLLYHRKLAEHLQFTPSIRAGIARMTNEAKYNGELTNLLRDEVNGTLFNWKTYARIVNLGLGLSYDWKIGERSSRVRADVYHIWIDSYNESNPAVRFSEKANMLAVKGDLIFPTDLRVANKRLDMVMLFGSDSFFGENRRTLGYTTSYELGLGTEVPLYSQERPRGHLRFSGQLLWADNMRGWLLTLGYNPE